MRTIVLALCVAALSVDAQPAPPTVVVGVTAPAINAEHMRQDDHPTA